jgi:hypothetical protein
VIGTIERRGARSVLRKMSISENYEGSVTPIRSYISIFSRGTVPRTILHLSSIALQALLIDKHKTRCYHLFPNVSRSASRIGSSFHLLNCVCPDNPGCH